MALLRALMALVMSAGVLLLYGAYLLDLIRHEGIAIGLIVVIFIGTSILSLLSERIARIKKQAEEPMPAAEHHDDHSSHGDHCDHAH